MEKKLYKLIGKDGKQYLSETKGTLGGHKGLKIYGRLDCHSALRYIAKGQYVKYRVFFADEETAVSAGYRPYAVSKTIIVCYQFKFLNIRHIKSSFQVGNEQFYICSVFTIKNSVHLLSNFCNRLLSNCICY